MKKAFIAVLFLLANLPAVASTGRAGTSGAAFLQLGTGAKASSMGEAQTAWSDDVYGMYFNPSGIATLNRQSIGFARNTMFLDLDYNYVGYVLPFPGGRGVLGVSGMYVDLGDVERREVEVGGGPSGNLGSASGNDLALSVSYARTMNDFLDLGGSLKLIRESLDRYSSSALAVDLGAKWRPPIPGLTVGASIANIGSNLKFVRESDELPLTLRLGAGYRSPSRIWGLTGDLVYVRDQEVEGKAGAEVWVWPEHLNFRAGINSANKVGRNFTLGAGFQWQDVVLDYAYLPFGELGDQNLVSLSYDFGPVRGGRTPRVVQAAKERPAADTLERPSVALSREEAPRVQWGAFAAPFRMQSGAADYAWMASAAAAVFSHAWTRDGFQAPDLSTARYIVDGDYWIVDEKLIVQATLQKGAEKLGTWEAFGAVDAPFEPWSKILREVNAALARDGNSVSTPAPKARKPVYQIPVSEPEPSQFKEVVSEAPAYNEVATPAPPVRSWAKPVEKPAAQLVAPPRAPNPTGLGEAPARNIMIASLREYPALKETKRSRTLAMSLGVAFEAQGWSLHPDAARRFEATVSFLDGGDIIVYGRIVERATGITLGNIEASGKVGNSMALVTEIASQASKIMDR